MSRVSWAGVYPAALTMFDADGSFNVEATGAHLDWLISQGAHGLIVGGSSGEFIALTDGERRTLAEVAVRAAAGRVPVIVGTGYYATAPTIELTRHAQDAGADGAVVVLPYYQRPSRGEVLAHYRAVAAATDIPIMIYNIPGNAATDPVSVADLGALYREGVAQGVKSTLPTVHQLHELRHELGDGFRAFYGGVTSPLEGLAGGAHGWVSGLLNVVVPDAVRVFDAVTASDLPAAHQAWEQIIPVRNLVTRKPLGEPGDLAIYRGILRIMGRPAGHCRLPLRDLDATQTAQLERLFAR